MRVISQLALVVVVLAGSQQSAQAFNLQRPSSAVSNLTPQQEPAEQSRRAIFEKAAASISTAAVGLALPSLIGAPSTAFASGGATAGKYT